jgi:hypothetical protein
MADEEPLRAGQVRSPDDIGRLSKKERIAFLRSASPDKIEELWNVWRLETDWAEVDLEEANLGFAHLEKADLQHVHMERAFLVDAHLEEAHLLDTHLQGADLSGAHLQGAIMLDAHLEGASLSSVDLERAYLRNAHLEGADLRCANLRDVALSHAASLDGIWLFEALIRDVRVINHDQLRGSVGEERAKRFLEAKAAYVALKGYFEDVGDYEGANWAYLREQQMEKRTYAPEWARRLFYGQHPGYNEDDLEKGEYPVNYVLWARQLVYEGLCNYGQSLVLPLVWMVVVMFGCAGMYYWRGAVVNPETGEVVCCFWRNYLRFSLGALTTTGFGDLGPRWSWVGCLMTLEALLGIGLTGLAGFILGNKIRFS